MEFTLNGLPVTVHAPETASLLEVLRGSCAVTSVRYVCAPEGSCSARTIMVEGKAVVSSAQPAARFGGRHITTRERLTPDQRAIWSHAFVAAGA